MGYFFSGGSVNIIWKKAYDTIICDGKKGDSEKGRVRYLDHVTFNLSSPQNRIVSIREPAISIAFACAEIVWILFGSNDSLVLNSWNPILPRFSGTGDTYYGAYGYRLRKHHGVDQIKLAFEALKSKPLTRQVVMSIWSPGDDLPNKNGNSRSPDIPCNICCMLKIHDGRLNWTQIMRSNDLFRGTPYNFLQFTILHELFCRWLNVELGEYSLYCDNLHIYEADLDEFSVIETCTNNLSIDALTFDETEKIIHSIYERMEKMASNVDISEAELECISEISTDCSFFKDVLFLIVAYQARKHKYYELMGRLINKVGSIDFQCIFRRWISR